MEVKTFFKQGFRRNEGYNAIMHRNELNRKTRNNFNFVNTDAIIALTGAFLIAVKL